jgi:hypothetical protein
MELQGDAGHEQQDRRENQEESSGVKSLRLRRMACGIYGWWRDIVVVDGWWDFRSFDALRS